VALVERTPRKVLLTDVGREIAARARDVLNEVEQIKGLARRTLDPESGTVRLGIFPTLAPYLLPHVVPLVRKRFPRLELLLVEEKTEEVLHRLHEGRLDAGIVALPVHEDSLHAEFLFEEPFLLAVPQSHPLAKQPSLKLSDLSTQSLLLLEDGHCLRDQALEVCHLAGAGEKAGFRATSLETLRQMVAANVGITLLPTLAVKPPVAQAPNVHLIEFRGSHPPSRRIAMLWRKSSAMAGFLAQLADVFKELPGTLLDAHSAASPPVVEKRRATPARHSRSQSS
jgi:LysR family hydrogen peroxide-inducible transcriptional activator